jgi:formate hydrogenlyase transcriptional activator
VAANEILRICDQDSYERRFQQIIGNSSALEAVLEQVERVAPTGSTVLIQGETGTGKELIAHAIHNISSRCGRSFVRLNCAAIPLDLLESELFGHEKGAFTGAIAQKIGRFELADKGTLFLDEVGDIPPALQPKLLRVLQEQEFERLGSTRTHQVDVRLVAATNRDLSEMVNRGEFRSDLYYRLNVFPLLLPPLRERREDIPALVKHFVEILGRRMGRQIEHIPTETMSALRSYDWPGNIRELQNLIERAVILSNHGVLPNPLPAHGTPCVVLSSATTLRDSERTLILKDSGSGQLGNRRSERRGRQTWPETHYADPPDAEAGHFSTWSPKQPECDGVSAAGAKLAIAIAIKPIGFADPQRLPSSLNSSRHRLMALSRTIESGGGPSRDRRPRSARDSGSSNEGLPRCRVGGPSTSDTERPDPTPRPGAGRLRPRAEGLRHGCCPRVARPCGQRRSRC